MEFTHETSTYDLKEKQLELLRLSLKSRQYPNYPEFNDRLFMFVETIKLNNDLTLDVPDGP